MLGPRVLLTPSLIVMLLIAACAGEPTEPVRQPAPAEPDTSVAEAPDTPSRSVDLPPLLDAGMSRPPGVDTLAVLDRLPEPDRITTEVRSNRHVQDENDTLRTHHYDGLSFTVVHAVNGKELMQRVTATGEQYASEEGLRVGMARSAVEAELGEPVRTQEGDAIYEIGEPAPTTLQVAYENGRVDELTWHFYID